MTRRWRGPRWRSAAATLALGASVGAASTGATTASAQPVPVSARWPPQSQSPFDRTPRAVATPGPGHGLRDRLGVDVARALLVSDDPRERLRGVERLGTIGDAPAIEALLEAIDAGALATRDPDTRLHAIRMLAPHADEARVRAFLTRELLGGGKASLSRSTAAMALARRGDDKALEALALATDQRGPASDAARAALLAYPPASLDPLLLEPREEGDDASADKSVPPERPGDDGRKRRKAEREPQRSKEPDEADPSDDDDDPPEEAPKARGRKPRTLTLAMIDVLADLGDLRALPALRSAATRKQVVVKAHAGLALARFGDPSGLADAREWAKGDDPRLLGPAAETLVLLGDPAAKGALSKLLTNKETRASGLGLLATAASPKLYESLEKELTSLAKDEQGADRARVVLALSRIPRRAAALLDGPKETRDAAAFAIATAPGDAARDALSRRLASAKSDDDRRLLTRAAIVRAVVLGDAPDGLDARLVTLLASKDETDAEIGALGLVATGSSPESVLRRAAGAKGDAPRVSVVAGAARGTLLRGDGAVAAFGHLLAPSGETADADGRPSLRQIAAGVALVDPDAASEVPLHTLLAWAEGGGALAPLAARALGARDDDTIRPRLRALLSGTDPVVRAHVALGLALDPEPSAASLLAEAYLHEGDAAVRRACVAALAERTEPQRSRVLGWAAALDPDEGTRSLARLALDGKGRRSGARLGAVLSMMRIDQTDGAARMTAARFQDAEGLAIPVVTAPDGVLLAPAAGYGRGRLSPSPSEGVPTEERRAPRAAPDRAEAQGSLESPKTPGQAPPPTHTP